MVDDDPPARPGTRGTGAATRTEAQRIALELFSTQGYEATSMREIAERLGVSKAALYYHFAGKDDIVRSVMSARRTEIDELLAWVRDQPPGADLVRQTVLRWVDATKTDKLRGIRFSLSNPTLIGRDGSRAIGDGLEAIVAAVAGEHPDPTRLLLIRMAFLSTNAAVAAARGTSLTDEQIVAGARQAALALLARLEEPPVA